ncbi:MAG: putative dehydrogenase [Mariniblastus sp.]|jgi:predicted dehydrogenase
MANTQTTTEKQRTIKWGILGPGSISRKFAEGLTSAPGAKLVAVGSRDQRRAQAFADEFADDFQSMEAHGSYSALAADPNVDAIYVGTPHSFHHPHAILCMQAGKHVLCEKPFAINARQAQEMVDVAREQKVILMEAMWARFLPAMAKVRELVKSGAMGEVRMVSSDFGFAAKFDPAGRLFDPALGGGAMLDVGIYPLSFSYMVLGRPDRCESVASLGPTGVDEQSSFLLGYESGQMAIGSTSIVADTPLVAAIQGTEGMLSLPAPWWIAKSFTVTRKPVGVAKIEHFELPFLGNGYTHQAIEFGHLITEGRLESEIMPLAESVQIMETLDQMRAQWGMKYPME